MRLLRAVRAHLGPVLLLAATTVLSVAAVVVATAAGGSARRLVPASLAVLALVVAAGPAMELARRRRGDLTLVRLRGASGPQLVNRVTGESVVVVLVGGLAGLAAGAGVVRLLSSSWDLPLLIGGAELWSAVLVTGALAVLAAGAAGVVAREPLQAAVRRPAWSGPGATVGFVGLVCAVATSVGAAFAVYSSTADDPGSLVLAAPLLVGVAAGQVAVWVARGLSRPAARSVGSRSTALLLGVRRALGTEHGAQVRAVVAAGVVAAAAAGAVTATSGWADESARLRQGGPLSLQLPDTSAQETLALTRHLDPDGRWLMAAAVNDGRDEARYRTGWMDLERFERVAAGFLTPTSAGVGDAVEGLRDAPAARPVSGEAVDLDATGSDTVVVTLTYADDDGTVSSVDVPPSGTATVDDCARACIALGLTSSEPVEVSGLSLGGTDLLDGGWVDESGTDAGTGPLAVEPGVELRPAAGVAPVPMLAAGGPDFAGGPVEVDDPGGEPRPLDQVGEREALPLVEGAGLLGDLPVVLAGAPGTIPAVRSLVLARADTPADVLAGLREAGAEAPQSLDPARGGLGARERAEDRVRRVGVVAASGLGLLALVTGRGRRRRTLAHDDAALRLVGVPGRQLRRARQVEAGVLAVMVLLATGAGGWLAATTTGASAPVPTGPARLPFDDAPPVQVLLVVALLAALATGLTALRGARAAHPAALAGGEEPER